MWVWRSKPRLRKAIHAPFFIYCWQSWYIILAYVAQSTVHYSLAFPIGTAVAAVRLCGTDRFILFLCGAYLGSILGEVFLPHDFFPSVLIYRRRTRILRDLIYRKQI